MLHELEIQINVDKDFGQCLNSLYTVITTLSSADQHFFSKQMIFQPSPFTYSHHTPSCSNSQLCRVLGYKLTCFLATLLIQTAHVCMKANKGTVRLSREMSDQRAIEAHVSSRCNSVPSDYTHSKGF